MNVQDDYLGIVISNLKALIAAVSDCPALLLSTL